MKLDTLDASAFAPPADGRAARVAVLGAGISGLVATYELRRRGIAVTLLERSGRVGGRIETFRFPGTHDLGELGAMRIPGCHESTLGYIAEMGLGDRLVPFTTLFRTDRSHADLGALASRWPPSASPRSPGQARREPEIGAIMHALKIVADAMCPRELRSVFDAHWAEGLREDLATRLGTRVDLRTPRAGPSASLDELVALLRELQPLMRRELRPFFRDVSWELSADLWMVKGGIQQLPERLAAHVADSLRLGCEVTSIGSHERCVELVIHDRTHGTWQQERFDYAICTIPLPALRGMTLLGFDARKLEAIRGARYAAASKVLLSCRRRFWQEPPYGIRSGACFIGGLGRQVYYNDVGLGDAERDEPGGALLAAYAIGRDAEAMAELDDETLMAAVRQQLGTIHPEILAPGMIMDFAVRHWHEEAGYLGGCSVTWPSYYPGASEADIERLWDEVARPNERVFFAGEHCSSDRAWIEGAVVSGRRAVAQIAQALQLRSVA